MGLDNGCPRCKIGLMKRRTGRSQGYNIVFLRCRACGFEEITEKPAPWGAR